LVDSFEFEHLQIIGFGTQTFSKAVNWKITKEMGHNIKVGFTEVISGSERSTILGENFVHCPVS
jgi:hypothetical protein